MKKFGLGMIFTLCAAIGGLAPAFAADNPLAQVTQGSLMVTRIGGLGAGMVLGCPVAIFKESVKSYIGFTQSTADQAGSKVGGKDSVPVCAVVSMVTLPAALVVGGAKGLYYGCKNGITHGFNEPFHPDSFSLGKLED